jgi:hypothetical protein
MGQIKKKATCEFKHADLISSTFNVAKTCDGVNDLIQYCKGHSTRTFLCLECFDG